MVTRSTLNWRFLIGTTIALVVTLGVVHLWHVRQVRKQTGAYLYQADLARDNNEVRREIDFLERYLRAQPQSNETRERLAKLYATIARTPKQFQDAFFLLEDSFRRQTDRDDLRRFIVDFAMDSRTSLTLEVFDHLQYLMGKYPNDAGLMERMGTYYAAKLDFKRSSEQFQKAYEKQDDRLDAYASRALIERERLNNPGEADKVIDLMIGKNPQSFRAHLYAFDYGRKYRKNSDFIKKQIDSARTLAPNELDVILAYIDWCRDEARQLSPGDAKTAKLAEAKTQLQRGAELAKASNSPLEVAILLKQAEIEAETISPAAAAKFLSNASSPLLGNVAVLSSLVDYQIQAGDVDGANETLTKLETMDVPPVQLAYNRARLNVVRGKWWDASVILQQILADQPSDQTFVRSVSYLLGRCYEQIGETDQRLTSFTRAIPADVDDPLWISAQLGQADAYTALGRTDDALRTYLKLTNRAPGVWLAIARLRILQALRTADQSAINWGPAEDAVQKCQDVVKNIPEAKVATESKFITEAKLVKAELFAAQKNEVEARKIIDPLFNNPKPEPAVWIAKAFSVARESNAAAGITLLEKGRNELGDPVELRLAQARLVVQVKGEKPDSRLLALGEDIERYSPAERKRLLRGLAETATASGFVELGGVLWEHVVQLNGDDLKAHLILFDRALQSNDEAAVERLQNEIERIDGKKGITARLADVFERIWKERRSNDRAGLDDALKILDQLEQDRPGLARIAYGKGLIYDRLANRDSAIAAYRKAVELGESQPAVIRRLSSMLFERGQYAEAKAVLNRLPNNELDSPDALRLSAILSLGTDNQQRALDLAAKAVSPDSKNPEDFLWQGRLLWTASKREEARSAFRKAKELNPRDPTAWLLLIETLAFENRKDEAESVFREAKSTVEEDKVNLFTAQAHKLMGQKQEALAAFKNARDKHPADVNVLRAEAEFLMSESKLDEACEAWKRVMNLGSAKPEEKEFARNSLAICVALHPDLATARTALAMLGPESAGSASTESISKRTRAVVLSLQRDRTSKLSAIKLFESMTAELSDNDRFLLAQWYFQVNNNPAGRLTMTELLRRPPADTNPLYLSYYARWLLGQREAREAEPLVAKLEKIEPNSLRTIELQVLTLAGQQKLAEARAIVKEQADKPNARLHLLGAIAESAGLDSDAESLYKRFVANERGKTPDVDLLLAGFYARRNRLSDALAVCEQAWKTCNPESVGQLCIEALSATPQVDPATLQRVAGWIEDARTKNPKLAPALQQQLAYVRNLQGQFDEAIRIYQGLSVAQKPDPTVLNNLAYLLSAHKGLHDEALLLINRAKEKGPYPDLLDTEALILMARGKPGDLNEARKRLQEALDQAPVWTIYFHLAQLEEKAGKPEASRSAWRESEKLKQKPSELHPLERPAFEKMARAYK
jgi:tetratricopeptide (TPR) repeat protein